MTRAQLISECKRRYESGENVEQLIAFLRSAGCWKTKTIAVIHSACGLSLAKAKEVVHFSSTWDDTQASDEAFHEALEEAVSKTKSAKP